MQAVHLAVEDWDAKIPDNLATKWHEWTTTISEAKDLAIPRPITAEEMRRSISTPLWTHLLMHLQHACTQEAASKGATS